MSARWLVCECGPAVLVDDVGGQIVIASAGTGTPALTPAEARRVARALVEVADRIDPGPPSAPSPDVEAAARVDRFVREVALGVDALPEAFRGEARRELVRVVEAARMRAMG